MSAIVSSPIYSFHSIPSVPFYSIPSKQPSRAHQFTRCYASQLACACASVVCTSRSLSLSFDTSFSLLTRTPSLVTFLLTVSSDSLLSLSLYIPTSLEVCTYVCTLTLAAVQLEFVPPVSLSLCLSLSLSLSRSFVLLNTGFHLYTMFQGASNF